MPGPEQPAAPTDVERLEDAMHAVIATLVPVVGLPPHASAPGRVPIEGDTLLDPERVPAGPLRDAWKILDDAGHVIATLAGMNEITVEAGLAAEAPPC